MPVEAAVLIFGGLGAAALLLYLINRLHDQQAQEVLNDEGLVKAEYKKSDEPPYHWTGWE
jgi:hypothetical protein